MGKKSKGGGKKKGGGDSRGAEDARVTPLRGAQAAAAAAAAEEEAGDASATRSGLPLAVQAVVVLHGLSNEAYNGRTGVVESLVSGVDVNRCQARMHCTVLLGLRGIRGGGDGGCSSS